MKGVCCNLLVMAVLEREGSHPGGSAGLRRGEEHSTGSRGQAGRGTGGSVAHAGLAGQRGARRTRDVPLHPALITLTHYLHTVIRI